MESFCQIMSMKNKKLGGIIILRQPTKQDEERIATIMFVYPIIMLGDNCFTQHYPNEPKFCTSVHHHMPNDVNQHHALPNWLEIFKIYMEKLKFRLPFVKHLPKCLLQTRKGDRGEMLHHNVTKEHHCNFVNIHALITKTLVNRSLTKSSKIHKKFKT